MNAKDIKVGSTYAVRGSGTQFVVLAIDQMEFPHPHNVVRGRWASQPEGWPFHLPPRRVMEVGTWPPVD